LAGVDGDTATYFDPGFYGSAGIVYRLSRVNLVDGPSTRLTRNNRLSKNFRLSAEYTNQSADAKQASANYGSGNSLYGVTLPGARSDRLNQNTLNAYYDAPEFGHKKRIRPLAGLGDGTQSSTLARISNTFAAPSALYANANAWAPIKTFQADAAFVVNKNTEIYATAKYARAVSYLYVTRTLAISSLRALATGALVVVYIIHFSPPI